MAPKIPPELRYDVLAVLQHTLDAAERSEGALEEARHRGDSELADAFRKVRDLQCAQLEALRELLDRADVETMAGDLGPQHPTDGDKVDEASKESFPASDSPAY